jgi:hypothetical protein
MGYPMVHGVVKQRFKRADGATCGARTRSGEPCKNTPCRGRSRCRMHGGKSWRGIVHPSYRHGRRSRDLLAQLVGAFIEAQHVADCEC